MPTSSLNAFLPQNQTLHPAEEEYIQNRKPLILEAWKEWIRGPEIGYNMSQFEPESYPTVGMALSGGGFRASLFSAGVLNAYDARNATAKALGTGGLYDVASYLAAASGGSWVIGSQLFNPNARSYFNLALNEEDGQGWLLDINIAFPNGDNILDGKNEKYYGAIVANTKAKAATSIPVSITDIWSGLLGYHFLNGTTRDNFFTSGAESSHGAGLLWSDIPLTPLFQTQSIPYPLVITDSRAPSSHGERPTINDIVYEISPFEWASWDPSLSSAMNLKFAGTSLNEGKPSNSTACVTGFDQAAYILGTSSNLWDSADAVLSSEVGSFAQILGPLGDALETLIAKITANGQDTALWPNSFGGLNRAVFENALTPNLDLDDGGENAANVPIEPLMLKPRHVDVVVAIDATAETTLGVKHNFPNGSAMNTASTRLKTVLSQTHVQAPAIPTDFALTGNSLRVSFFGCDSEDTPLIIYIPNSPPCTGDDPVTNTGAFQPSYSVLHQTQFFSQSFLSATCGFVPDTTGPDPDFPLCLKCAALDRARLRSSPVSIPRSEICQQCFTRYCFNPSNPPSHLDLPGRKFTFVSPDGESALSSFTNFLRKDGIPLFVVLGILSVLSMCVCSVFAVRRRRKRREKINLVRQHGWGALAEFERAEERKKNVQVQKNGAFNFDYHYYLDSGLDACKKLKLETFGLGVDRKGKRKQKGRYTPIEGTYEFESEYREAGNDSFSGMKMKSQSNSFPMGAIASSSGQGQKNLETLEEEEEEEEYSEGEAGKEQSRMNTQSPPLLFQPYASHTTSDMNTSFLSLPLLSPNMNFNMDFGSPPPFSSPTFSSLQSAPPRRPANKVNGSAPERPVRR